MEAEKFISDEYMTNSDYAILSGIEIKELNILEAEFMVLIDFNLLIDELAYIKYCKKLEVFQEKLNKEIETRDLSSNEKLPS